MNILVVESAAKARTLESYLGEGWKVFATGGHVETLPNDRAAHGKDAKKAYWSNRSGELPAPPWVWTDRGEAKVKKMLEEAGDDPTFWIATDPDREGEFIAWCLDRILGEHGPTHRITFQEVTKEAVQAALEHPRGVDSTMVDSALVRKFLDRLVGFRTSSMARGVVGGRGTSMGRVQTPTLGFVVEREMEREAHVPIPYFEVRAAAGSVDFQVRFHEGDAEDVWKDDSGKAVPTRTFDGDLAQGAFDALTAAGSVEITDRTTRSRQRRPSAPFSTDALLQAAGSRFGWTPRKTSALASALYEAGHITYIRTDSNRLAASFVEAARGLVKKDFGDDFLGSSARAAEPQGPVQDAHEAIRPTRIEVAEPATDDADARKLYRLVRAHTLASQMAPSQRTIVSLTAGCEGLDRPLQGSVSWRTFAGWEAVYDEFLGPVATAPPEVALEVGAEPALDPADGDTPNPRLIEDETRPPPRYRPHTLVKAMKDAGIGRPSTYSRTVEKLEEREYVAIEDGALAPTDRGRAIWTDAAPLYATEDVQDAPSQELFSPEFTAVMEARLDEIASGERDAPSSWEIFRDQIRDLHEAARERRNSGRSTPRQQNMIRRLLDNAADPSGLPDAEGLPELTYEEAQELTRTLREQGVKPAATQRQKEYLEQLVADLALEPADLREATGLVSLHDVRDSDQASAAIDTLQQMHDERQPASSKQRRYIGDLIGDAGLSEAEALALVEAGSMDDLTGGREGSASRLIEELKGRVAEAEAEKEKAGQPR